VRAGKPRRCLHETDSHRYDRSFNIGVMLIAIVGDRGGAARAIFPVAQLHDSLAVRNKFDRILTRSVLRVHATRGTTLVFSTLSQQRCVEKGGDHYLLRPPALNPPACPSRMGVVSFPPFRTPCGTE
jgi:hypothetical protein